MVVVCQLLPTVLQWLSARAVLSNFPGGVRVLGFDSYQTVARGPCHTLVRVFGGIKVARADTFSCTLSQCCMEFASEGEGRGRQGFNIDHMNLL